MRIDLVIFDCDGTLIDSEYIHSKATSDILTNMGYNNFTIEYCMNYFAGCSMHDVLETLKKLNILEPTKILKKMHDLAVSYAKKSLTSIDGAHELLSKLTLPKSVASNGEKRMVVESLRITGLKKYFQDDTIFTRELVKNAKPAPDLYLYTAEKMGNILPKNCLVIEDSIRGITAGKKAGMNVLGFVGGNHHNNESRQQLRNSGAMQIIENLSEVMIYL